MTLLKLLTATLLGMVSLSPGAVASRDLLDWPGAKHGIKKPEGWDSYDFGGHKKHDPHKPKHHKPKHNPHKPKHDPHKPDHKPHYPPPSHHSGGSSGGHTTVRSSSASCSAVAIGYTAVNDDDAKAHAKAAAHFICGKGGNEHDIAKATAKAYAIAVAHASVNCKAHGNAKVSASAYAKAEAKAVVWLEAYADAFAHASCKKCDAYAASWGKVKKKVFLHAVAVAKASIDESTYGGKIHEKAAQTVKDIEVAVATAYAKALASAKSHYGKTSCVAWVEAGGAVISEDHGVQGFKCEAHAASSGSISSINAIAVASADAAALTCGGGISKAKAKTVAKAIAEATAIAVSYVYAGCKTDKGAYACAVAHTHIEQAARAVAAAFAKAWAGAIDYCDYKCKVDADAAAQAIGSILVKAATNAYGGVCVSNGDDWSVYDLQVHIERGYIEAIAKAWASAISSNHPQTCAAAANVYVSAGR